MNVEHLLNVFISIDTDSEVVLDACSHFMNHLYWHKPRQTVLGPKIEGLPDDNPSKLKCLTEFSRLFVSVGNPAAQKRLLSRVLELERVGMGVRLPKCCIGYLTPIDCWDSWRRG